MKLYDFFEYHEKTKHSYLSIRSNPNRLDWLNQPNTFKNYDSKYKRIFLDKTNQNFNFLYLIAGISAKKIYGSNEYYLRVNPSAGALYPNEIYFQSRSCEGLIDGIYHFEISSSSIVLLKELKNDEGIEGNLNLNKSCDGFIFFISSIYYRSSWKYKNRAFRYCLLDSGHILGTIEHSSYLFDKEMSIAYDFDKKALNKLFSFDNKEFFTSLVFVGKEKLNNKKSIYLNLPCIDGIKHYMESKKVFYKNNEIIEKAYIDSININNKIVQLAKINYNYNKEKLEEIIFKRRSIREFNKEEILQSSFQVILDLINLNIISNCEEEVDIYYINNRVKGLPLGLYKNNECIKKGDFRNKASYLCLEQDLGKDSAATFFFCSKGKNYQALYEKAGLLGHRLYISSNYLGIQCSGIGAYYDDEVCEFLGEYTMVLYAFAIGN